MLTAMSVRSWFRGHRNVFSYTNEWVDNEPGTVDDLEEEYGERASEESSVDSDRPLGWPWRYLRSFGGFGGTGPRRSVDGILEIGSDSTEAEEKKPPPQHIP
jgi:hypothetical protein